MANEGKKCATYFFSPKTSLQKIIVTFAVFLLLGSEPQSVTGGLSTQPAVLQQTDQLSDFLSTFFSQKCHDDRIRLFDNCFLILGQFFFCPNTFFYLFVAFDTFFFPVSRVHGDNNKYSISWLFVIRALLSLSRNESFHSKKTQFSTFFVGLVPQLASDPRQVSIRLTSLFDFHQRTVLSRESRQSVWRRPHAITKWELMGWAAYLTFHQLP